VLSLSLSPTLFPTLSLSLSLSLISLAAWLVVHRGMLWSMGRGRLGRGRGSWDHNFHV